MGKFNKSRLNDWYSDWHWGKHKEYPQCQLTDIDRLWVECRSGKPLLMMDIKEPDAVITWTQEKFYTFAENEWECPIYIVYPIFTDFNKKILEKMHVMRWKTKQEKDFTEQEYWEWLKNYKIL